MRRTLAWILKAVLITLSLLLPVYGQNVTLTGTLQSANGLPAANYTLALTPTQWFFIAGTGVSINSTVYCGTSSDGTVHEFANPTQATVVTPGFTGTLPAANYYVEYTFYVGSTETLPSPESIANLSSTGNLTIPPPASGIPAGATGMKIYIGTTSGGETLQGSTIGTAIFNQSTPLATGANPPGTNTTVCSVVANDAGWPTGTGYTASLTDPSGNTLPGYPMTWQLLGPNSTINLSNGLPYYHGVVTYPVPILASPLNHAPQSISGPLSMTGYTLVNVGKLGVGTGLPAWGVDVEGDANAGVVNAKTGFLVNGTAGTVNQCLASDGTYFDQIVDCYVGAPPTPFYQIVINGSHDADKVTQRDYLAVGSGTGLVAQDVVGIGTQVGRTVLKVNATGSLTFDPEVVIASAAGTAGHIATWDSAGGITDGGSFPTFTGTSGYQALPGGLIIEFGLADSASASVGVTFPLTFPHALFSVTFGTGNFGANASRNVCYIAPTPSTSSMTVNTDSSTVHCYWTAIGY